MNFIKDIKDDGIGFQLAPMIDIVFLLLVFFMVTNVYHNMEMALDITVPKAATSGNQKRLPGEIIINISKDGIFSVNQKILSIDELAQVLMKVSRLYEGQPVIIRGDSHAYHKHIIQVLDVCSQSGIWNISFATVKEYEE
ncbi:MAG: biopolymer transporter ExbD [Candidatus Aureabacteria bacterium]|nr:biopolymer transporter ExbD [Candidatus Auribacterota bacterium]